MENASKAIVLAGTFLISIVIISLLMLMVNSLTDYQKIAVQNEWESQVDEFNQQFEGYKRNNVRGNELLSLVNKIIDYNYRKSSVGNNDEKYQKMEITIDLKGKQKDFSINNNNQLLKPDAFGKLTYKGANTDSSLKKFFVDGIEYIKQPQTFDDVKIQFTDESLKNLVLAYNKIFISGLEYDKASYEGKIEVYRQFNSAYGDECFKISGDSVSSYKLAFWQTFLFTTLKSQVETYYEYMQFKRAHFNCVNTEYNDATGRIVKMYFEFTGEFN